MQRPGTPPPFRETLRTYVRMYMVALGATRTHTVGRVLDLVWWSVLSTHIRASVCTRLSVNVYIGYCIFVHMYHIRTYHHECKLCICATYLMTGKKTRNGIAGSTRARSG